MVTSTVHSSASFLESGGNLGSWQADLAASSSASPSGSTGMGMPMHPRRPWSGYVERVTKTPLSHPNSPSLRMEERLPEVSDRTVSLAALTALNPQPSSIN